MSEKKQIRRYLKRVRYRMKRKQRYFLYGIILATTLYLAEVWQLRERIWSIRELDVIEYEVPEWGSMVNGEGGDSSGESKIIPDGWKQDGGMDGTSKKVGSFTRIRLHLKTGELEILHERTESEEDTAGNVEK